jgi:hypothetical protein
MVRDYDIVDVLNSPEEYYPDNFNTAMDANAFLLGLCQEAAEDIKRLRAEVYTQSVINSNYPTSGIPAIKVEDIKKYG